MKTILIIITSLIAASAIVCGMMMLRDPDGSSLQLPLSVLGHTNFKDFAIPGYLLIIIVGGSNSLAAMTLFLRQKSARFFSVAAGLFISVWIATQLWLINVIFWLQFIYLFAGIVILLISFPDKRRFFER
ncbi:MAG: hypothetical protein ABJB86_00600 [Bacteroidota bacterium]